MPEVVFVDGHGNFRNHMRDVHGARRFSDADCEKYIVDKENISSSSGEVRMSARQFSGFFQQVNQNIQSGIDRGLSNALNLSAMISHQACPAPVYLLQPAAPIAVHYPAESQVMAPIMPSTSAAFSNGNVSIISQSIIRSYESGEHPF